MVAPLALHERGGLVPTSIDRGLRRCASLKIPDLQGQVFPKKTSKRCTTCSGVYVPNGTFIHLLPTSHFPCLPLFPFSQDQFYPQPLHFFTRSFIMILYTFCLTNIRSRIRSKVLKDHIPSPRAEDLSISSQSPRTSSGLFYSQYHTY